VRILRCGGSLDSFLERPLRRFGWLFGRLYKLFDEIRMKQSEIMFDVFLLRFYFSNLILRIDNFSIAI
jgi:hypothetical protein